MVKLGSPTVANPYACDGQNRCSKEDCISGSIIRRLVCLLMAAVLGLTIILTPSQAQATYPPGANGKIAFQSDRDGNWELYVMNPDGSGLIRMTATGADEVDPKWSPDGTVLAFSVCMRYDQWGGCVVSGIGLINADGTGYRVFANPDINAIGFFYLTPAWSPDGSKLAYSVHHWYKDPVANVWRLTGGLRVVSTVDGSLLMSTDPGLGNRDGNPDWSPDGTRIVFNSTRAGAHTAIYTVNWDGSGLTLLSSNPPANDWGPRWSPDGRKVSFNSDRDGDREVYIMSAEGWNQTRLTFSPGFEDPTGWSPDGTRILFSSQRDENLEIYTMNADGSGQTRLTLSSSIDGMADWQRLPGPLNRPPVANNDSYSINEDSGLSVQPPGLLANDADADGNALSASLVSGTSHGSMSFNLNGSFSYAPSPNWNGTDYFTYKASDGQADSNVATIHITVNPVNDPPVANDDTYAVNEDNTLTVGTPGVLANDSDVDSPVIALLASVPAHGTVSLNADGSFSYAPNPNWTGTDSFIYVASDGYAWSNRATAYIQVNPVNDMPTITSISNNGPVNSGSWVTILWSAYDPDWLDQLTYWFDCDGDGLNWAQTPAGAGGQASCLLSTPGTYPVGVAVSDDKDAGTFGWTHVTVVDSSPPTTTAALSGTPGHNGWYISNVQVTLSAADNAGGTGVSKTEYSLDGVNLKTYAGPFTVSAEGTTTVYFRSWDKAGNVEATQTRTVQIDKTPPTIVGSRSPQANPNGWNNVDVTVHFSAADGLSGVAFVTPDQVLAAESQNQAATGTATDKAGNAASTTVDGINIDKTPPTLTFGPPSPAANAAGWNKADVSTPFTATDSLSGVAATSPPASPIVLTAEGPAVNGTVTVADLAGNSASFTSPAVKIDKTPPVITVSRSPAANTYGWNNSDVAVSFACSDATSGISFCSGPTTLTAEGTNQFVAGSATDQAGNSANATASGINIDKTKPTVSNVQASPNPAAIGVAIGVSADTTSGVAPVVSAEYRIDGAAFVSTNAADGSFNTASESITASIAAFPTAGVHDVCVRAADAAGNVGLEECTLLAVYDPSAGFVTGGGWINSPVGAYAADTTLTGKATFGFVSKYQKGATVPTGQTEFQFRVANLNFHSDSYEWLVVSGARAQYKGWGTINGAGDYGFILTAIDGQVPGGGGSDKFRIKVWNRATSAIVYDNQMGASDTGDPTTVIGGGSIVIQSK